MKRVMQNERGIALAVAIFALVIVGALVAGAFFVGTQEQRVAESSRRLQQSFGIAEVGVGQKMATWNPNVDNVVRVFPADSITVPTTPAMTGTYGGIVRKLNPNMYLIDITAQDSISLRSGLGKASGGARQRVGLLARVRPLEMDIQASLTTQGDVALKGQSRVDGSDHLPPGWTDCDPLGAPAAGIRVDQGTVTVQGQATVAGAPPVRNDTSVGPQTFTQFGDVSYDQLAARATITLPGGTYQTAPVLTGGACDKSVQTNWGDGINHASLCASYFPVIHIKGSVVLNGVQGQGILMVDGDLSVQGSYEFFGITIVRGSISTSGGGTTDAHFWGTVMAQNVDLELQNASGKATLNYSKCAIIQALQMNSMVVPMVSRGWAQLF